MDSRRRERGPLCFPSSFACGLLESGVDDGSTRCSPSLSPASCGSRVLPAFLPWRSDVAAPFRIPRHYIAACVPVACKIGRTRTVHLGDEWWCVPVEKGLDFWQRRNEIPRQLGYGTFPITTSRATPCRITASRSLGLWRMRWSWVSAMRPVAPQYSSYSSSEAPGSNRSWCRSTITPAAARMAGNCLPRSRSVK